MAYLVAASFLFTYQTCTLVMEWVMGSKAAFGPNTGQRDMAFSEEPTGYAMVNLVALLVGVGLVISGMLGRQRGTAGILDAARAPGPRNHRKP